MRHFLLLAAGAFAAPALAQTQPVTGSQRAHLDAQLCPDASHVAFRVNGQALGIVDDDGQNERLLHTSTGNALSSFVWHPINNSDIYFADGNAILRVSILGGAAVTLAPNVAGSDVRMACIDPAGLMLFGTRRDAGTNTAHVWRMPASGVSQPVDIVSRPGTIDELRMDDVGRYLLLRSWNGATPVPATFVRFDQTTSTSLPMATFNDLAESAQWVVPPTHFVVSMRSPAHATRQVARVDSTGGVVFLTDDSLPHTRTFAVQGSHLIACETLSPTGGGVTVALVPNHGGGSNLLDAGQSIVLNGGSPTGGLSFDAAERRLAFSAGTSASDPFPQVYVAHIHGEIHFHPMIQIGQPFTVEHHVHAGEFGAVAVADGLTAGAPLQVPPLGGELWLDARPGHISVVLSGPGNASGSITAAFTVPLRPQLIGLQLFFQGVTFDATLSGEFTRFGYFQVF
jgi:hypothetical protein